MGNSENNVQTQPESRNDLPLKYAKLVYHYLICHAIYLFLFPLLAFFSIHLITFTAEDTVRLWEQLRYNPVVVVVCSILILFFAAFYFMTRPRKVYLVNFACYKPGPETMLSREAFVEKVIQSACFTQENIEFQKKIIERSGMGQKTYIPKGFMSVPFNEGMSEARKESEMVMFGAIDELLAKTSIEAKDIGILVVNCSVFNPGPSLSSMVVNHYKMRENIKSVNLGGMGCSAGLISIDLAKQLLTVHPNSYALVVSIENGTMCGYHGNQRSMLIGNCIFRTGGAAIILSNKSSDCRHAKYQLIHTIRTHKGADDKSYSCIFQKEDDMGLVGISLSKDLMAIAGETLKRNIKTLGPLVLPLSEQILFFIMLVARNVFKMKIKSYIPNFKAAIEHFCIHPGGMAVFDAMEKNLELSEWHMEPARMTLYRFGNTSSSSIWYELAYMEGKGRIRKGDRIWQIAVGSGFKCNSTIWKALDRIDPTKEKNPWMDEIHDFPVEVARVAKIA